jgi:hypothetical protein
MRSHAASFRQLIHLDRSSTREARRQAAVEYYRSVLPGTPKAAGSALGLRPGGELHDVSTDHVPVSEARARVY